MFASKKADAHYKLAGRVPSTQSKRQAQLKSNFPDAGHPPEQDHFRALMKAIDISAANTNSEVMGIDGGHARRS